MGITGFNWVLVDWNGFYWFHLGFSRFEGVITRFYWVLLGFTVLNWV